MNTNASASRAASAYNHAVFALYKNKHMLNISLYISLSLMFVLELSYALSTGSSDSSDGFLKDEKRHL
eukprot:8433458-Karenia_brevis.AAC.1